MFRKGIITTIIIISCFQLLCSQTNLKVGYVFGIVDAPVNNQIVNDYNAASQDLQTQMPGLRALHGIELGVRYKLDFTAIDFSWSRLARDKNAVVQEAGSTTVYNKDLKYRLNTYAIGIENIFNSVGFGANYGYSKYKIITNVGNTKNEVSLLDDDYWSSKFYLIWNASNNNTLGVSIRPYVQVGWSELDLSDYSTSLSGNTSEYSERPLYYGISVLFYNGRQN